MAAIGMVIAGKYEVVRLIGEGGMSRVYLAMDLTLNKQWAIKEIKPSNNPVEQEIVRQSLVSETNMIKQFDHPALPRITDLVNEKGILYVVMDYIEGESLNRVLKEHGPQSQEDVIEWGKQLCEVLDYLHTRTPPVIYRDMKPANVMLTPDGTVKIIDFGIAREYREEQDENHSKLDDTTMLGTKGYAAPEQFGGLGQTDARTDVYCLGATLYHLLTGKSPAEPPYVLHPIRQINPSFSPGLEKIISKATQQNPDKRYSSCAEMLYELEHFDTVDDTHRKKLKSLWRAFMGVSVAAFCCMLIGVAGLMMAEFSRNSDYDHQINLAEKAANQKEAARYYLNAISILPNNPQAYLALIGLYKKDASFSLDEESQMLSVVMPNLAGLETQGAQYTQFAFALGKLYWYYYDYASDAGENRLTRIKAAGQWMSDAASLEGVDNPSLVEVYDGIADFNNEIVARINEGEDTGLYEPYFRNLEKLNKIMKEESNDVIVLETAALTNNALQTYARKFRADGITQSELEALWNLSFDNSEAVVPTTEKLDETKSWIQKNDKTVRDLIEHAYMDARSIA